MGFSATDAAELRPYADNVMITGVKSKPELNGKLGMIVGPFDLQSGRISVLVEGTPAAISLKPENLEETGMPEGSFYHIHPSGSSTMPQQDQKPTAKAKPRRRKRAASPEPEPEPEPSEKRRRKRVAKEDDDEVAELKAEAERFCSQGATPVNAAAEAEEEEEEE